MALIIRCLHEGCGRRFSQRGKLKRHEKVHKGMSSACSVVHKGMVRLFIPYLYDFLFCKTQGYFTTIFLNNKNEIKKIIIIKSFARVLGCGTNSFTIYSSLLFF